MKNWKTTTIGILTAFFAFVAFDPQWFPAIIVSLAKFFAVGGLAALGLTAKDSDSHSTFKEVETATREEKKA
jgi:hypothetical protein